MSDKQPIYILPENVSRTLGKDAQRNNILAAKVVAEVVKTTLGPKGMDKMLVDSAGNITVTNDGVTILNEMEIEHPAAKAIVEIAKTQESEVGDGTTTAVMLAGKLLENAEKLLDKRVHPTVITKGYRIAAEKARQFVKDCSFDVDNADILKKIAMTAMTGKGAEGNRDKFADLIVQAVQIVGEGKKVDVNAIKIEKMKGESMEDSELIKGIVLDKEIINQDMPRVVENAKIALIDFALEIKNPEVDTKVSISTPEQLQSFIESEERLLKVMTEKVSNFGANVIFCQKGIDDVAQYYLAKKKILACRRVSKSDMEKLAKATGGKIVSNINELSQDQLGKAARVEEKVHGESQKTYITGCENPRAITIMIHGSTEHIIDEIERAIKDGLGDVIAAVKDGKVVAGGGAIEIEVAKRLREFSKTLGGREQLAVDEFANAMEYIPETLAENAGLDSINIITELKQRHSSGGVNAGINLFTNKVEDCFAAGIIEPMKVKTLAISSAAEVAVMILRIDDVLISSGGRAGSGMPTRNPYEGMD